MSQSVDVVDLVETQKREVEDLEELNSKNYEEFDELSIWNKLVEFEVDVRIAKAFSACARDLEYRKWLVSDSDRDETAKKAAIMAGVKDALKLKKLGKLMERISEADYKKALADAANEWGAKKAVKRMFKVPEFLKHKEEAKPKKEN